MASIVKVAAAEKAQFKEVSTNEEGFLCISELRKQFPNCVGIRYRTKPQGVLRGTLITGDQLHLPVGVSWKDYIFHCVFEDSQKSAVDQTQPDAPLELETFEMIVLGLPSDLTDSEFRRYFSTFGKLKICTLKSKRRDSRFNTYGFLQYEHYLDHNQCMITDHIIKGANVVLRLPSSKMNSSRCVRQLFITNITPSVRLEDIVEYFSCFGKIEQLFMPPVASPYAFLTFESKECVSRVLRFGKSHRVFGGYVLIEEVRTKREMELAARDGDASEIDDNMSAEDSREELDYSEQECSEDNQYGGQLSTYENMDQAHLHRPEDEYAHEQKEPLGQYLQQAQQHEARPISACQNGSSSSRSENGRESDPFSQPRGALEEQRARLVLEREQFAQHQRDQYELQQRHRHKQVQAQLQALRAPPCEPPGQLQARQPLAPAPAPAPRPGQPMDPYRPAPPPPLPLSHPVPHSSSAYTHPALAFIAPNPDLAGPVANSNYHLPESAGRDQVALVHHHRYHPGDHLAPLAPGVACSPGSQRECARTSSSSGGDPNGAVAMATGAAPGAGGSAQLISELANSILERVSAQQEDVLVRVLLDQLAARKRRAPPSPPWPDFSNSSSTSSSRASPAKVTRALQLLQNPAVLDSLIRLSDNIGFGSADGGGAADFPGRHDDA